MGNKLYVGNLPYDTNEDDLTARGERHAESALTSSSIRRAVNDHHSGLP